MFIFGFFLSVGTSVSHVRQNDQHDDQHKQDCRRDNYYNFMFEENIPDFFDHVFHKKTCLTK